MVLTMSEKKSVAAEFHKQEYESLSKKRKNEILREFTMLTGSNRSYVARILSGNSPGRKDVLKTFTHAPSYVCFITLHRLPKLRCHIAEPLKAMVRL